MRKVFCVIICSVVLAACSPEVKIQRLIDEAVADGLKEVIIPVGTYLLEEPIRIDGVEGLKIMADSSGSVEISTRLRVNFEDLECVDPENEVYQVVLPELISSAWPDAFRGYAGWAEVFIHGQMLKMSRHPNHGFIQVDSIIDPGSIPRQGDSSNLAPKFISKEAAILLAEIQADNRPIYLNGYWKYKWYDEVLRVDNFDPVSGAFTMAAAHNYGLGAPSGGLFYIVNHKEFIDQPGEYAIDVETGTLTLQLPFASKDVPYIDVSIKGFTLMEIIASKNIELEGIKFNRHGGMALDISNSEDVSINKCGFFGLSTDAIHINGGKNCSVVGSSISKIGGTGVSLNGGEKMTLTPSNHSVVNCWITDFARHVKTYAPAVKLEGVGQTVSRCRISNAPHNAIYFTGNDHMIENNHIKLVCLNTSDAGAIYCGRDWTMGGTVIRFNSIQELGKASHHHNWAIYLDDLASGIEVTDNVITDCPSGILVGGGRYNKVNRNKIRNCPKASIMYDARGLGWASFFVSDPENIMWERYDETPLTLAPWKDRFPWLIKLRDDDPAYPKQVEILDNDIFHSALPDIHPTVKEFGKVQFQD